MNVVSKQKLNLRQSQHIVFIKGATVCVIVTLLNLTTRHHSSVCVLSVRVVVEHVIGHFVRKKDGSTIYIAACFVHKQFTLSICLPFHMNVLKIISSSPDICLCDILSGGKNHDAVVGPLVVFTSGQERRRCPINTRLSLE